jgi:hypothetical protein
MHPIRLRSASSLPLFAICLAAVLAFTGCRDDDDEFPGDPAVSATVDPLNIRAGDYFEVSVDLTDFMLDVDNVGGPNRPGYGHFHVYLNQIGEGYLLTHSATSPVDVRMPLSTEAGTHDIIVSLHQNDHSPLSPAVYDTVQVTVEAPPPPTLTASVENPVIEAGGYFVLNVDAGYFYLDESNIGGDHIPRHGHYHVYLNQIGPTYEIGSGGYATTPRQFTMPEATPEGPHDLIVVLHYNDHQELSPPLSYTIEIDVVDLDDLEYEVYVEGRVAGLGAYLYGNNTYIGDASVLAYGVYPVESTVSANTPTLGEYRLTLPVNGQVVLYTNKAGYFPTYTEIVTQEANILNRRIYLTELAWLNQIAEYHSIDLDTPFACQGAANTGQNCIYSAIVGRILDDGTAGNGTPYPVAGIAAGDFTITGGPDQDDWYTRGPYFLELNGTAAGAGYSLAEGNTGGLFVAFVEVPQIDGNPYRTLRVSVAYGDDPTRYFGPVNVQVFRPNGVTWTTIPETGVPLVDPVVNVDFDTQVYPLFLPVSQGGLGCQGCHAGATPAGNLDLYGAETAYASLNPTAYPQRVNLEYPAQSYLLRKPLYGEDLNHPIFAFTSTEDVAYRIIYQWIYEGAEREVELDPTSYRYDVYPLLARPVSEGGAGCYSCHVAGVNAQTAPGGFYLGGGYDDVHYQLTQAAATDPDGLGEAYRINKANYPDRSLVLVKPLYGSPAVHPVKIFSANTDPRYQILYRWIVEGWVNDYE